MQTFQKIDEEIESIGKYSYILIRVLKTENDFSNLSDYEIINNLINSEFHIWLGEGRTEKHNLPNFYGYHNYDELNASDYTNLSFKNFKLKIISIIENWHQKELEICEKAKSYINSKSNLDSPYYFLDLNENEKKAAWHVYSVFAGFISINRFENTVSLIEFGED